MTDIEQTPSTDVNNYWYYTKLLFTKCTHTKNKKKQTDLTLLSVGHRPVISNPTWILHYTITWFKAFSVILQCFSLLPYLIKRYQYEITNTFFPLCKEPVIELHVSETETLEYSPEPTVGDTRIVAFADSQAGAEDSDEEKRKKKKKRRAVKSKKYVLCRWTEL